MTIVRVSAALVFVAIQALQVVISPIPGEITGPVGGALFGTAWGVVYSNIGLTIGTVLCFAMGRKWGEPLVRPWLSEHHWDRLNFILEAEGAILCFILYLIPGFPKDVISYLFGISPIPFWVFAVVSTVARVPGTWISSYFGGSIPSIGHVSIPSAAEAVMKFPSAMYVCRAAQSAMTFERGPVTRSPIIICRYGASFSTGTPRTSDVRATKRSMSASSIRAFAAKTT